MIAPICECGCGQIVGICERNDTSRGWVKGQPKRFVNGHCLRQFDKPIKYDVTDNGCWEWLLYIRDDGYGQVKADGRTQLAHRWMYETLRGVDLPDEVFLDHTCRNRKCVNPSHLEPVTFTENIRRGLRPIIDLDFARLLRNQYASGNYTQHALAEIYGISRSTVAAVVQCRIWREGKCILDLTNLKH